MAIVSHLHHFFNAETCQSGSVAKLAFEGQIQKSGIRKSMTCESQLSCFR